MAIRGHVIIIVMEILSPFAIIVLYALALTQNHIRSVVTFISTVGSRPIESCIFSFFFNLKAAMLLVLFFMRYLQLLNMVENSQFHERRKEKLKGGLNCSLWCGFLGCFGYTVMGSFQNNTVKAMHVIGMILICIFIFAFFVYQTYFTFALAHQVTSIFTKIFRISLIITMLALEIYLPFHFTYLVFNVAIKKIIVLPTDPIYIAGVFIEWVFFTCVELYIVSFYSDFKYVELHYHKCVFLESAKFKKKTKVNQFLSIRKQIQSRKFNEANIKTEDVQSKELPVLSKESV